MTTSYESAFGVFKQFPEGLADFEFKQLLGDGAENATSSALLSLFVAEGLATKMGTKTNPATMNNVTVYVPNGRTFAQRRTGERHPTRRRRGLFEAEVKTLRAALVKAENQICELVEWKASAEARFPELRVDQAILKARERVASVYRDAGDEVKASMAAHGELDNGDAMRVAISLMRPKNNSGGRIKGSGV